MSPTQSTHFAPDRRRRTRRSPSRFLRAGWPHEAGSRWRRSCSSWFPAGGSVRSPWRAADAADPVLRRTRRGPLAASAGTSPSSGGRKWGRRTPIGFNSGIGHSNAGRTGADGPDLGLALRAAPGSPSRRFGAVRRGGTADTRWGREHVGLGRTLVGRVLVGYPPSSSRSCSSSAQPVMT